MRVAVLGTVCALAAGCAAPDLDRAPWVELGTGDVEFVPLSYGAEVSIVHGLQGGDHIWGSARATGLDWREVTMTWELLDEEGEPASRPSLLLTEMVACGVGQEGCARGMGEVVGFPVIVDSVSSVAGDEITMRVVVEDAEGRTASDEQVVAPVRSLD